MADFSEQIRLEPDNAAHYNNRGLAYEYQGDLDRSLGRLQPMPSHSPRVLPLAYCNRGSLYVKTGDFAQALTDFNEAIRRAPEDAERLLQPRRNVHGARPVSTRAMRTWPKRSNSNHSGPSSTPSRPWHCSHPARSTAIRPVAPACLQRFAASQDADDQSWTAWTCALAPHAVDDLPAAVALANKVVRTDPESTRQLENTRSPPVPRRTHRRSDRPTDRSRPAGADVRPAARISAHLHLVLPGHGPRMPLVIPTRQISGLPRPSSQPTRHCPATSRMPDRESPGIDV